MNKISTFPNGKIILIQGKCIYLPGNDIDTDRIIPARYLKCINFDNLGNQVFADDRNESNGNHPFDKYASGNVSILIVGKNFGCGSSREHAPQALMRWGIRAIIGESFAEIFYSNCLSLGIPCVTMEEISIKSLINTVKSNPETELKIDLLSKNIFDIKNNSHEFIIDESSLLMLISGKWDVTSILLKEQKKILKLKSELPYLNKFSIKSQTIKSK